ncbi:glutaredoxin family protein [Cobetia amphilecti]|uniref:Glutaredoxin family protein n=1 Tax=Cobetia amphilecti TaxID=1055104 RepID=A0AAP4X294_9GAMM|nr:glutaredoxin family protein [Cobetia amphilecti]MDO6672953.1 glutaredoxin family protein [Cobetia amphilecti]
MASVPLWLYTTAGCHLCARLEATLQALGADVTLTRVEIAFDTQLSERYATRIPVLASASGAEYSLADGEALLPEWLRAQGVEQRLEQGVEITPPAEHDSATEPQSPALRNGRRFLR